MLVVEADDRAIRSAQGGHDEALEIVALARHADGDSADAGPGVEPCAESVERAVVGGHRAPGEAERRYEESAALVEHGLFDYVVRPQQPRLRNRQPESLGSLEVDDQLELRGLLDGGLQAATPLRILSTKTAARRQMSLMSAP